MLLHLSLNLDLLNLKFLSSGLLFLKLFLEVLNVLLELEMAKYQGWRGVQGNFRGKVEVQLQLGWLQRKVDKYQGWRGVQGNFRGKVEERVQQKGNRRGGAGPGWLAAAPTTGPRKKQRKGGKVS